MILSIAGFLPFASISAALTGDELLKASSVLVEHGPEILLASNDSFEIQDCVYTQDIRAIKHVEEDITKEESSSNDKLKNETTIFLAKSFQAEGKTVFNNKLSIKAIGLATLLGVFTGYAAYKIKHNFEEISDFLAESLDSVKSYLNKKKLGKKGAHENHK